MVVVDVVACVDSVAGRAPPQKVQYWPTHHPSSFRRGRFAWWGRGLDVDVLHPDQGLPKFFPVAASRHKAVVANRPIKGVAEAASVAPNQHHLQLSSRPTLVVAPDAALPLEPLEHGVDVETGEGVAKASRMLNVARRFANHCEISRQSPGRASAMDCCRFAMASANELTRGF